MRAQTLIASVLLSVGLWAGRCDAEPAAEPTFARSELGSALAPDMPEPGLWRMAGSMAMILGLLLVSAQLLRRFAGPRFSLGQPGARLRLAQTLPLGNRRFLSLVEADGQSLLLAISGDRIELLHVLGSEKEFTLPEESSA